MKYNTLLKNINAFKIAISSDILQENLTKCGIYTITNISNNKIYVGVTIRGFITRWLEHQATLFKNVHCNIHLQKSFNKYGYKNFIFSIYELFEDDIQNICNKKNKTFDEKFKLKKYVYDKEIECIKYLKTKYKLYNITSGGEGAIILDNDIIKKRNNNISKKRKEFFDKYPNEKIKISIREKKRFENINERIKISISQKKRFENINERIKISKNRKKYFSDIENKKKHSLIMKEWYKNENNINKQSNASKEKWKNEEIRNKMINGMKNASLRKETQIKRSNASKEKWKNEEIRNKIINGINSIESKRKKSLHIQNTKHNITQKRNLFITSALHYIIKINPIIKKLSFINIISLVNEILQYMKNNNIDTFNEKVCYEFMLQHKTLLIQTYANKKYFETYTKENNITYNTITL